MKHHLSSLNKIKFQFQRRKGKERTLYWFRAAGFTNLK